MSDRTAPQTAANHPLGAMTDILAEQAAELDRMFYRAAIAGMSDKRLSHRDVRKALKAQERCHKTIKILLALRAAADDAKKFSDSYEGTIESEKSPT